MTRISFLMPTYNRANFIGESIASIVSQMAPDDELLIVDDGSTDGTSRVVKALAGPIRYLRQSNAGKSAALNRGLAQTDGHYVWICDDDDVLRPGAVELLMSAIERTGADVVFGRYTRFRMEQGRKVDLGTGYWPDLTRGSLARHILEDAFVMHNASLVRRGAYDRVGPFDETMLRSLDYEMFVRLALRVELAFEDAIIFDQRKHEGARGPAKALHAAGQSDDVWKEFDRRIFAKLGEEVPLDFFEAMFSAEDNALKRRAALLQRAAIMGRHDLWDAALDDLESAGRLLPRQPLTSLEAEICRRAVAGKHGFRGLVQPSALARLNAIKRETVAGRDIVLAIAGGTLWRLRKPEPGPRHDALVLLWRSAGIGLMRVVLGRLVSRFTSGGPQRIIEKSRVEPLGMH